MKRILITGTGRCGTSRVFENLRYVNQAVFHGECLNRTVCKSKERSERTAFYKDVYSDLLGMSEKYSLAKILTIQFQEIKIRPVNDLILKICASYDQVILMPRENRLDQFLSFLIAIELQNQNIERWNFGKDEIIGKPSSIQISNNNLAVTKKFFLNGTNIEKMIATLPNVDILTYEEVSHMKPVEVVTRYYGSDKLNNDDIYSTIKLDTFEDKTKIIVNLDDCLRTFNEIEIDDSWIRVSKQFPR